ncbi:MAG: hypothetical protein IKR17_11910 [Bacteroidales bacterium]|nr:hypothetical protein [Bacteroidales bacterium]
MNNRIILYILIAISGIASIGALFYDLALSHINTEHINGAIGIATQQLTDAGFTIPDGYNSTMTALMSNLVATCKYHALFCVLEIVGLVIMLSSNARLGFHIYAASQIGIGWLSYKVYGDSCFLPIISCFFMVFIYYRLTHAKTDEK